MLNSEEEYTLHKRPLTETCRHTVFRLNLKNQDNGPLNTISPSTQGKRTVVQEALGTLFQPIFLSLLLSIQCPRQEKSYING